MPRPSLPPGLAWVLAAVALAAVAWAFAVPVLHAPDEDAHVAYVQTLAELGRRPAADPRPDEIGAKSTEQRLLERTSGFARSHQRVEVDPEWSAAAAERWAAAQARLGPGAREDGGDANPAQANPPTYYAVAALSYRAAAGASLPGRIVAVRLWSALALLVLAGATWLLAGELLGRDRPLQVAAAAVAGLWPMGTSVGAAVTPDALLLGAWAVWLWLAVRAVRGRDPVWWLLGATVLAVAVKPVSVVLAAGAAWVLVARRWGTTPRTVGAFAAGALAVFAAAAVAVPGPFRQFASYLWQHYLPELPGQDHVAQLPAWPAWDRWVQTTTGAFGWLEVRFPGPVYVLLGAAAVLVAVPVLGRARLGPVTVLFAVVLAALVATLHLVEQWYLLEEGEGFIQGRYVLPLLPLAGCAVAAALAALPARRRGAALGAVLGGMCAWQLASLAIVVGRFHA